MGDWASLARLTLAIPIIFWYLKKQDVDKIIKLTNLHFVLQNFHILLQLLQKCLLDLVHYHYINQCNYMVRRNLEERHETWSLGELLAASP